jgi:hypothetical protein
MTHQVLLCSHSTMSTSRRSSTVTTTSAKLLMSYAPDWWVCSRRRLMQCSPSSIQVYHHCSCVCILSYLLSTAHSASRQRHFLFPRQSTWLLETVLAPRYLVCSSQPLAQLCPILTLLPVFKSPSSVCFPICQVFTAITSSSFAVHERIPVSLLPSSVLRSGFRIQK